MNDRELAQRLWVSSRFLWVFYLLIPLAVAGLAVSWLTWFTSPDHRVWILVAFAICLPRALPWLLGAPFLLTAAHVTLEGDTVVARSWRRRERVPLSDQVELAQMRDLPSWFGFDADPSSVSHGGHFFPELITLVVSMFANPKTREQFLLSWRHADGRARSVSFVHPARLVEGNEDFQPGMERLIEQLGISKDRLTK